VLDKVLDTWNFRVEENIPYENGSLSKIGGSTSKKRISFWATIETQHDNREGENHNVTNLPRV